MRTVQGIYLLTGSNLGHREENLRQAAQLIGEKIGPVLRASAVYASEAWGETDQPDFCNQVLEVETNLTPEALLRQTQEIEQLLGKIKLGKWRERLIDIDILYYRNTHIHTADLQIPHPEIQNRNFVLMPLCDMDAEALHPLLLKSHRQLLAESPDPLKVWKHVPENGL